MLQTDFSHELKVKAEQVNSVLADLLNSQDQIEPRLRDAMRYTLEAPGKRVRAALVLWCCEAVGRKVNHNAEIAAAAIEMVHTYSLIHDDLPAMDNDDLRRGQPTCHKAFDEATAILTGDALLTLAFEILAKEMDCPDMAIKVIAQLAEASGPAGMIAGQMADLQGETSQKSSELLEYIHINKTARMFQCSATCGGIVAGAQVAQLRALWQYGLKLGLAFQIADDILDVCGSSEQIGKTAGKDANAEKCTYLAIFGLQKAKEIERKLADEAIQALTLFGSEADILRQLPVALLNRAK